MDNDVLREPKWYETLRDIILVLVIVILWVAVCLFVFNLINPNEGKSIERYKDYDSRPIVLALHP